MRKLLTTLITLFFLQSEAAASPADDAVFLTSQHLNSETVQAVRRWAARIHVRALANPLAERDIKIRDADRFAEMIPNEITDLAIRSYLESGERIYLETFSSSHLDQISTFHRLDVGQKLLAASSSKASKQMSAESQDIILSGILELDETEIKETLSSKELSEYAAFINSDAGEALQESWESIMRRMSLALINGVWEPELRDSEIALPFMLEVFETKGVLSFPNPITRQDSIQKLRTEIDQ